MKHPLQLYGALRGLRTIDCSPSSEISKITLKPQQLSRPENTKKQSGPIAAFIGPGVKCRGVMTSEGQLQIDGLVDGEIHTKGTLLVGEQAVIKAKIRAGSVISKGQILGNIMARREIRLLASATIKGSLNTPYLSVEKGATVDTNWSLWVNRSRISGRRWIEKYPYGGISHPTWWSPKQYREKR